MVLIFNLLATALLLALVVPSLDATLYKVRKRFERSLAYDRYLDQATVLDIAAAALSAGASIPRALEAVDDAICLERHEVRTASVRSLREVGASLTMGATWQEAWLNTPEVASGLRLALAPAWEDGAAPVPILLRHAQTLRMTRSRQAKAAAAELGARLVVPLAVCFLPAFLLLGVIPVIAAAASALF